MDQPLESVARRRIPPARSLGHWVTRSRLRWLAFLWLLPYPEPVKHGWTAFLWAVMGVALLALLLVSTRDFESRFERPLPVPGLATPDESVRDLHRCYPPVDLPLDYWKEIVRVETSWAADIWERTGHRFPSEFARLDSLLDEMGKLVRGWEELGLDSVPWARSDSLEVLRFKTGAIRKYALDNCAFAPEPTSDQPDAAPDTSASTPRHERIIKEEVFRRLHVDDRPTILVGPSIRYIPRKGSRTLTGYEVERAGGIQEAVQTVPGVTVSGPTDP